MSHFAPNRPRLISTALGALLAFGSPLLAQESTEATAPSRGEQVITFHCAGLDALLVDPRDVGLRRALSMLDERLLELPEELGKGDAPPELLNMLFELVAAPIDFEVRMLPMDEPGNEVPVIVELRTHGDDTHVDAIEKGVAMLLAMTGMSPQPAGDNRQALPLPMGQVVYGPTGAGTTDRGYVIAFGEPRSEPFELGSFDLPDGIEPVLAMSMNFAPLQPAFGMLLAMGGADADEMYSICESIGIIGDQPLAYSFAGGYGDDRAHWAARTSNWAAAADFNGSLVREPLTGEELRLVPADATRAMVTKMRFDYLLDMIEDLDSGVDLGEFEQMLGIDLRANLFDHMGDVIGGYMSDSTGGGGLLSTIVFMTLANEAGMRETIETVANRLEDLAAQEADGRVRVRRWDHGATNCWSVVFPGLPVPIEPSLAIADGVLLAAASPQALMAAMTQRRLARSASGGIVDAPRFREMTAGSLEDLQSMFFQDTPRLIKEGYGIATLASAALANAVRSTTGEGREPGLVLPTYADLMVGAKPTVALGRIDGDDLVVTAQYDRSTMAFLTSLANDPYVFVVGLGIAATAVIPMAMQELRYGGGGMVIDDWDDHQHSDEHGDDGDHQHSDDHGDDGDHQHSDDHGDDGDHPNGHAGGDYDE